MLTIIGGSGFIGTRLCKNLSDGKIPFEIIDLKKSRRFPDNSIIADIRDYEALKKAVSGRTILNLAAIHRDDVRDKSEYYSTNVEGTRNVCRVAHERGIEKIVFTSSVAVYGFAAPDTNEDGLINPFNDYGKSKYQAEKVLRSWHAKNPEKRTLVIVRPTVVFGEGNRGNVYNLLRQIQSGKFIMIGSGKNRKSMAYVGNIAAFLEMIISSHKTAYGLYNYIDKPDLDMNSLVSLVKGQLTGSDAIGFRVPYWLGLMLGFGADLISKVTGKSLPISSIRVKKFCTTTAFSSSALQDFDSPPPYPLTKGLERTLDAEFLHPDPDREIFFTE